MRTYVTLLVVAVLASGCSGQATHAAASPTNQASTTSPRVTTPATTTPAPPGPSGAASSPPASPVPVTGAFGVLVTSLAGDNYTVSLVATNGKVVGSAQASSPTQVACTDGSAAVVPPPVSASNSRVYYMDAQGVVRFLTPQGETGRATTVPTGGGRRSTFSVSPDDQRIAVVVDDYVAGGVSIRLYVEDLNGGTNHIDTFTSSGAFGLWPVGWHGTNQLVVAKVPACAQGAGFGCCGPQELHVVDPATARRQFTLGGTDCLVAGEPTAGGVLCESAAIDFKVFDWVGNLVKQEPSGLSIRRPAYLSPDGQHIALPNGTTTGLAYETGPFPLNACGWIDSTHLISGGDAQHQPRVGDTATGNVVAVAAIGDCGGRVPGGL